MKKLLVSSFLLGMSLVACQDKFNNIEEPANPAEEVVPAEEQVTLLEFDAELDNQDEARANYLGDITLTPNGFDHIGSKTPEYSPIIKFRAPSKENDQNKTVGTPAMLIFCGVDAKQNKTFYRVPVRLSVIQTLANDRAKVRAWVKEGSPNETLFKVGENNQLLSDKNGQTWYAMIMCGGEEKAGVTDAMHFALSGREQAKSSDLTTKIGGLASENAGGTSYAGDGVFMYRNDGQYSTQNMDFPFASQWKKVTAIEKTPRNNGKTQVYTAKGLKFNLKPQGIFLTYHLGVNINYGIDLRRIGIVSNAVDFQGKYNLDDASLTAAFNGKNNSGWGIPAWEGYAPDAAELQGIKMYTVNHSQDPGLFGAKTGYYPWDMPLIQDAFVKTTDANLAQLSEMSATVAEGSIAQSFPWNNNGKVNGQDNAQKRRGMSISGFYIWTKSPGTDLQKPVGTPRDYVTYTQWAMPKPTQPQANQRFTYLWVQANASFRPDDLYSGTMSSSARPQPVQRLGFIQQKGVRVQPMVVVHQTNRDFSNQMGKTPHLNAVLTSDLLISELKYEQGYSVVELHNTTQRSIDLSNYALVRLIDTGSEMLFRKADGKATDDLQQAELYRLSGIQKVNNSTMSLYFGTDYTKKASPDILENDLTSHAIHEVQSGTIKPLLGGQTVLIGASGYTGNNTNNITNKLTTEEKNNVIEAWCRYFVGVNSQVLALNHGDGIALVRLYNGGRTKKVIDTTAPIGSSNYGFAGTYQSYKTELNKWKIYPKYSQQRTDGVSFPFMPPYRTKRETANWADDWSIKHESDLGDRNNYYYKQRVSGAQPYVTSVGGSYFSTIKTPLRPTEEADYRKARPTHR